MATTDERLTRVEDALWDLAMMVSDGKPARHHNDVNRASREATKRFYAAIDAIQAERSIAATKN